MRNKNRNKCFVYIFLVLLLPFSICHSQTNNVASIKKNRVRMARIFNDSNRLVAQYEYDTMGNLIFQQMDDFAYSKFLRDAHRYWYDENGQLSKEQNWKLSSTDTITKLYSYDSQKNLVGIKYGNGNEEIFQYDSSGFKIKDITKSNGKEDGISVIRKLNNGRTTIASMQSKYYHRQLISNFDEDGNVIKSQTYKDKKLVTLYEAIYKNHLKSKVISYEPDGKYEEIFIYDNKLRLIKRSLSKKGKPSNLAYEEYEYDDNDLIKSYSENLFSFQQTEKFHYLYDLY